MELSARPVEILLVEDNPGDARLAREAVRETGLRVDLAHVTDGVQAVDYLHQAGAYAESPHPDLVLLDLNLPRKDGREVLVEIKSDARLRRIPVAILTTSSQPGDVIRMYENHANCYIVKPITMDRFLAVVSSLGSFWLKTATLPPGAPRQ